MGKSIKDEEIVELYFQRDELAIAKSQEKYGGYCYTIGYNILYSNEDTEECVNETWLKAWNAIPPKKPSRLGAFFGKITRFIALDKYKSGKRQKRGGEFSLVIEELDECIPDGMRTEDCIDKALIAKAIQCFLEDLSEQDRAVFLARYWYAYAVKDVAEKYSLNLNTVKSSLLRSRYKLKACLEKEGIHV